MLMCSAGDGTLCEIKAEESELSAYIQKACPPSLGGTAGTLA